MKNYKNSDEFTRLLGARLADDMIDESLDLYKAGKLNADQFLKASGLRYIEPGVQRKVLGEIQAGNIESAKGFYQQEIIREGFFDYHKAEHPLSFKNNVIGRLFGRFGTYPVNFLENVKRGWRNAPSFGEKLAYGATFVGIHGALYGAYKEVFGVDAKNFLFWQSSSFSGGPYYNILNDSLKAIGGGPDAAQARGRALRNAKWFMVPGGTQIKSLNKAFKRYDEGDMHGFWLNLFSMPEDEEFDGPFWTR